MKPTWKTFVVPPVAVALAMSLRFYLREQLPEGAFVFLHPAVAVSAWFGGGWGGLAAILLGEWAQLYYVLPPHGSVWPSDLGGWIQASAFFFNTSLILIAVVAMQLARRRAESASRAKSDFLSMIGHEVRTPINSVLGLAEELAMADLSASHRESLRLIKESALHQMVILNELLDYSKIEAGAFALHFSVFELDSLVFDTVFCWASEARGKGLSLNFDSSLPEGLWMRGDPVRIRQVITNLVSNAVKFTREGEISVRVSLDEEGRLNVQVSDTGMGIDARNRALIFEPFYQIERQEQDTLGGTGLGLPIARQLARLMGGDIDCEPLSEGGSRFSFTCLLEAAAKPSDRTNQGERVAAAGLRIAIAEDHPVMGQLILRTLERMGHHARLVTDGRQLLMLLGRETFDVAFLDIQMPEMDGYEAARRIRAGEVPGREDLPLIANTAHADTSFKERCHAAGIDAWLEKPMTIEGLQSVLEPYSTWSVSESSPSTPKKILVPLCGTFPHLAFDRIEALRRLPSQRAANLAVELIDLFLENNPIEDLRRKIDSGDMRAAGAVAHQAATFSATLGAKRLGELFGVLERLSSNSEGPGEIHREIRRIESEFSSVRQELAQIRERC